VTTFIIPSVFPIDTYQAHTNTMQCLQLTMDFIISLAYWNQHVSLQAKVEADSSPKLNHSWPLRIESMHLRRQSLQLPDDDRSPSEEVPTNPPPPRLVALPKLATALQSLEYPKNDSRGTRRYRSPSLGKSIARSQADSQSNETPSNQSTTDPIYRPLSPIPNHP